MSPSLLPWLATSPFPLAFVRNSLTDDVFDCLYFKLSRLLLVAVVLGEVTHDIDEFDSVLRSKILDTALSLVGRLREYKVNFICQLRVVHLALRSAHLCVGSTG